LKNLDVPIFRAIKCPVEEPKMGYSQRHNEEYRDEHLPKHHFVTGSNRRALKKKNGRSSDISGQGESASR